MVIGIPNKLGGTIRLIRKKGIAPFDFGQNNFLPLLYECVCILCNVFIEMAFPYLLS